MSYTRNMKWLNDKQIIYRKDPINDKPSLSTKEYDYYENGTHEYYRLFYTPSKITTYKSLKWHFFVLYYLNMDNIINSDFVTLSRFIANKDNGFVTFFIKNKLLEDIIGDVLQQGGEPPKNKLRKIIFKMSTGLSTREKLSIVGKLIGRSKVSQEDIYNTMICMSDSEKITISKLAKTLKCSTRTIHRRMSNELKLEKERLNEEI